MTKEVNISLVRSNPDNPRIIKDDKFKRLVESVKTFPEMLKIRPIVVDESMMVLGGNMRLKACKDGGIKKIWIHVVEGWSEDKKKEFTIKDNVGFGDWDWNALANEWDAEKLEDWGLEIPDFSQENENDDFNNLEKNQIIELSYTEKDYNKVKEGLSKIASTPEGAVWSLLNF
jgi:ParB-like chromosome segregation protein Spo0J